MYRMGGQQLIPVEVISLWGVADLWHSYPWPWTVLFIPFESGRFNFNMINIVAAGNASR